VLQVTAPRCRVLFVACATGLGPIEHEFDPSTHPVGRHGHLGPDRLEHLPDEIGIDVADGQIANDRIDKSRKRILPLLPMLIAAPARLMQCEVRLRALLEGHRPRISEPRLGANAIALLN
jgi:hypothetical protein